MKKRIISLILCMAMLLGLFPTGQHTLHAHAEEESYKTDNVTVPDGWNYVEASTRDELEALYKQGKWWDKDAAEGTFVRLTADIHVEDTDVSRDAFSLIYISASRHLTIDFNGHTISGRIRAINNQDNKTWNTLNIKMAYGGVPDLTLRLVDSVGGGGVTLDAETLVDGPSTALCITADYLGDYSGIERSRVPYDNGATVIIDGGSYNLSAKNKKFITSQLSSYVAFTDSEKKPCWNSYYNPFTRSAVGLTGIKSIINNGHFTADNNVKSDDTASKIGNRYVSGLGLGSAYAVAGLTINGGKFDGSAYAVFFDNTWNQARQMPVLNGGTFSGGIMLCSTSGTWWNKTNGVYDMDNESRSWPISRALKDGAVLTMDGQVVDPSKTKMETIGWPHEITIANAPEITQLSIAEDVLFIGEKGLVTMNITKKPDSISVQKRVSRYLNGRTEYTWRNVKDAKSNKNNENYQIEIPSANKAGTDLFRIIAKFGDFELITDTITLEWVNIPKYRFILQPASREALINYSPSIRFAYSDEDQFKKLSLFLLKGEDNWEEIPVEHVILEENHYIKFDCPTNGEEDESAYKLVLSYFSPKQGLIDVESEVFTIQWLEKIPEGGCAHESIIVGAKEATHMDPGYTGDEFCILCGTELKHGEVIPKVDIDAALAYIKNLTPSSEDPIYVHVGETVTVSFDAVIDANFLAQGNTATVLCGFLNNGQYYSGKTDEKGHCSIDITFYTESSTYWNGYISLYDKDQNFLGSVDAEIVFICDESACKHDYQLVSNTATCGSVGLKCFKCSKCGAAKTEQTTAVGEHVFDKDLCYDAEQCYKKCLVCGEKVDVQKHSFKVKSETPVNCTEADVTYECTRCHFVKTERKTGCNYHTFNLNFASYIDETYHGEYCTKCGELIKEKHSFDEDDTCTNIRCYYHKGDLINAKISDGSYMLLPKTACVHNKITVDLSHVSAEMRKGSTLYWYCWSNDGKIELGSSESVDLTKLTAKQKAAMEGKWLVVELKKDGWAVISSEVQILGCVKVAASEATCNHDGAEAHLHCLACGGDFDENYKTVNPVIPATGQHVYDNACDPDCNNCGTFRTVQHSFSGEWESDNNGHFRHCTVCGLKGDYSVHTAGEWIIDIEPTCTKTGKMHLECTTCGKVMVTDTMPAEHTYTKTVVEATCDAPGSITWVCEKCGHTVKETIPALEHKIAFYDEKAGTCVSEGCKAHYGCVLCGKAFTDKTAGTVIQADTLIIPKNPENHFGILFYGSNADNHWGICKCGAVISEKEAHNFVEDKCSVCKILKAAAALKDNEKGQDQEHDQEPIQKQKGIPVWIFILVVVLLLAGMAVVIIVILKRKKTGKINSEETNKNE